MNEALFKCVVENDIVGVKTYVEAGEDVNAVKEEVASDFVLSFLSLSCGFVADSTSNMVPPNEYILTPSFCWLNNRE